MRSAPDDDGAHRFALHRDRGGAVDDQRARHARFAQLEHREARALQQRARLVDEHVQRLAGAVRGDEAAQRRAVAAGRDRAGVAVRQHVAVRREQRHRRLGDAPVDVALLVVDAARFAELVAARGEHAVDRPRQVHRRRPRGANLRRGAFVLRAVAGVQARGERDAVRAEDADRRRAAHRERANRVDDRIDRRGALAHDGARQRPLIEKANGVVVVPDRIHTRRVRQGSVNYCRPHGGVAAAAVDRAGHRAA